MVCEPALVSIEARKPAAGLLRVQQIVSSFHSGRQQKVRRSRLHLVDSALGKPLPHVSASC
jgi:hypothetical protein